MHLLILSEHKHQLDEATLAAKSVRVTNLQGVLATALEEVVAINPTLALIQCGGDRAAFLVQLAQLQDRLPLCIVVPFTPDPDPAFLLQLIRMGVPDVVTELSTAITVELVGRIEERQARQSSSARKTGQCIAVMSVKGGSGATLLVTNLAIALADAAAGRKVLLIDAALPFGDADIYLNAADGEHHLGHFHDSIERLDTALFGAMVRKITPGLDLITAPPTIREVVGMVPERIVTLIKKSREIYDYVLVDTSSVINQFTASIIEIIDKIYIVSLSDILGIKHAAQVVSFLNDVNAPENKIYICVNRWEQGSIIGVNDIAKAAGQEVSHIIPEARALLLRSISQGRSIIDLAPKSHFSEAVAGWAAEIDGTPQKGKSLWTRLRGK